MKAGWLALLILPLFILLFGSTQAQEQSPTATPEATTDPVYQQTVEVVATPVPTPSPEVNPGATGNPLVHLVAVGESLSSLAAQSGFLVSDLAQRNDLTHPNLLVAGQKVNLPAPVSEHIRLHRVTTGETLSSLAAQYGISPYLLRQTNKLSCADCLVVGQLLRIPQSSVTTNLPEPFDRIDIWPSTPRQGDIVVVRVTSSGPLEAIVGTLAGRTLHFAPQEGTYAALTGVGALQEPGVYSITLRAIASSGASAAVSGRIQIAAGGFGFENLFVNQRLVPLLDPQVNLDERTELDTIQSQWSATQWWQGPLQLPVASSRIASYYGTRRSFNGGLLRTYHSGADLVAPVGTSVYAAAPGRVVAVQEFRVRGLVVILDHGRGVFTTYCHLSGAEVSVGQIVDVGQLIARSGNTGRSEGPHLHWELSVGGVTVDPLRWVERAIP
jgi:murein DD-endopeptidase MepM/ murein hydrolase activator NlpD